LEHDLFRKPASTFGDHALGTGRVVQTGIEIIKIIYNEPGKQREDQYGGDPSEDIGPPFPPVIDQQFILAYHIVLLTDITAARGFSRSTPRS
jgi:hypothetical protein